MIHRADVHDDLVALDLDGGHVLLQGGVLGAGDQLNHLLAAAHQRHARVEDLNGNVAAMHALVEFHVHVLPHISCSCSLQRAADALSAALKYCTGRSATPISATPGDTTSLQENPMERLSRIARDRRRLNLLRSGLGMPRPRRIDEQRDAGHDERCREHLAHGEPRPATGIPACTSGLAHDSMRKRKMP